LLATMNGGISSSSISFLSSAFGATLVLSMCFLFLRVILETNRFNINTENVSENVFYNVFEDFLKTKLKKNPLVIAQKQTVREVRIEVVGGQQREFMSAHYIIILVQNTNHSKNVFNKYSCNL
jgi:hypothetical protein